SSRIGTVSDAAVVVRSATGGDSIGALNRIDGVLTACIADGVIARSGLYSGSVENGFSGRTRGGFHGGFLFGLGVVLGFTFRHRRSPLLIVGGGGCQCDI